MRVLFWGETKANVGPQNINRSIVEHLTDSFVFVPDIGKYQEMVVGIWKLLHADALVVSGVSRKGAILTALAYILHKPTAYIMHGNVEHEALLNKVKLDRRALRQESCIMQYASSVLPVSRRYMDWVKKHYSRYADKTKYIYNGIDESLFAVAADGVVKQSQTVAVSGGLTPLKNNIVVMQAIEKLDGKATLFVYGGIGQGCVREHPNIKFMGQLSNEEFIANLAQSSLFVLNSLLESFSIATIEALACGCSVLISEKAGVSDLLALEDCDIIHDPMNAEEIRSKIEFLLEHPNNERIRSKFNPDEWSFEKMVSRLEAHCRVLLHKE